MRLCFVIALLLVVAPQTLHAQFVHYNDVSSDAWYREQLASFLDDGYLDPSQPMFRPGDRASRAEFMKLVVGLNGGILVDVPTQSSFTDVSVGSWYFGYLEESVREGWLKGDGNCYGTKPCNVRPNDPITRAEAALLIRRAFGKAGTGLAPAFSDNPGGTWFAESVQAAADHCILKGDDNSRSVRPGDNLNRAEMIVMLWRVDHGGQYPNC